MSRKTMHHSITNEETLSRILPENIELMDDFLIYLKSMDRSENTIKQYKCDLQIFFVYNLEHNENKRFVDITKREFVRFQNFALNEWEWSSSRIRTVKAVLSSLSHYIEDILDDEYPNFRCIIHKIESPARSTVWEKSVFSEEELQRLLNHLVRKKEFRKAAVLALAMYSGRRKSEIPRFKASFFREENVIFDSFWKTDEKVKTKGRGSKGKQIHLYVLKDKFEPYLDLWLKQRPDSEWLFPSARDPEQPITITEMDRWKAEFTEFLGKDFYWHSMRHFFTTMLARQEVPVNVIQDIIQWESADMVKLYTDISADENIGAYFNKSKLRLIKSAV